MPSRDRPPDLPARDVPGPRRRSEQTGLRELLLDEEALRAMRRVRDRIDRDYAGALDTDAMAAEAGFSKAHFTRTFARVYGETPAYYRTRRRMERASELLRSVNLTVTEICLLVGFTSLGTFSSRFTEIMGMSPSAYRKEAERQSGPAPIPGCFAFRWRTGLVLPSDESEQF